MSEILFGRYGHPVPQIAVIDETACIGCALCIPACPVDAIVGSNKQLHAVIDAQCTGCEQCLPPCPVDCIRMKAIPESAMPGADAARARHEWRNERMAREAAEKAESLKKAALAAARARAKRNEALGKA